MLDNLPVQYRKDPWIMALAAAVEAKLAGQRGEIASLPQQMSLDTVSWNLPVEERVAGISPAPGASLEQRRTALKARWRSSGKATLEQIQTVAQRRCGSGLHRGQDRGPVCGALWHPGGPG